MAMTKEYRFARTLVEKISVHDFNDAEFSMYIGALPGPVIERVIKLFAAIIWGLSNAYDQKLYNDGNVDAMVKARRMQDVLQHYPW